MTIEESIYKFCLKNAYDHQGKASQGAIIGKLIAEEPSNKDKMKELAPLIAKTVAQVNKIPLEQQEKELKEKYPELLEKKVEEKVLPELPNAVEGKVVMRMAPNPNGPLHIGHSRMIILNDEYTKKYKGKLILRFDDTDPKNDNKKPMKEAYAWAEEDLKWLDVGYRQVERASARLNKYYSFFTELLEKGFAFVCTCEKEHHTEIDYSKMKEPKQACPCRPLSKEEHSKRWQKMLSGEYKQGQAVGRIKTSSGEKDPAVIDWPTFRIVDEPEHPLVNDKHVWPMLDFASAYDDHDMGTTHIIRGKDLVSSEKKQRVIYDYLNWKYPETAVHGKVFPQDDMVISKSQIYAGIKEGKYSGYDDIQLATLRAFRRKGILPQAIRNYMVNLGLTQHETTLDKNILYNENKKLIDAKSNRYFAVLEPVEIELKGLTKTEATAPLYPEKPERGERTLKILDNKAFIAGTDAKNLKKGEKFRLLQLANFSYGKPCAFVEETGKVEKKLHWVSEGVPLEVVWSDGFVKAGLVEKGILDEKPGTHVQFERMGYFYLEHVGVGGVRAYFTHE